MYKVVVGLFLNGTKHVRGDMLDISEDAALVGTSLEFVPAPPKPKRAPRKKKVVKSED